MPNLTAAARRRLIVTAARGFDVKHAASLAAADAFVALAADGMSTREISAALTTEGALFAPAYGTVARYVKVRKSLPDTVTAEDFITALRAETAARSKSGANNHRENDRKARREGTATPAAATVTAEAVTLASLLADLATLTTAATALDAADRAAFAAALMHSTVTVTPTIAAVAA